MPAVWGPARLRVMLAIRHAYRMFAPGCGDHPDGSFIASALFVHVYAGECDLRSVGRRLRVGNPNEVEEIRVSDGTRPGSDGRHGILCSERSNNCEADDRNS